MPVLVLMRDDGSMVSEEERDQATAQGLEPRTGYTVAGLVKKKLLFKSRPKMGLAVRNR